MLKSLGNTISVYIQTTFQQGIIGWFHQWRYSLKKEHMRLKFYVVNLIYNNRSTIKMPNIVL